MEVRRKDGINYFRREKEMKYDRRVTFLMEKERFEVFKEIAELEDRKPTELVRILVEDYINKKVEP